MKPFKLFSMITLLSITMHIHGIPGIKAALLALLATNAAPAAASNNPIDVLPNIMEQTSFFADTPTLEHGSIFFPSVWPLKNCLRSRKELASSWYHDNTRIEQTSESLALQQLPRDTAQVVSDTNNFVMTELLTPLFDNHTVISYGLLKSTYEDIPKRRDAILAAAIECRVTRKHYREQLKAIKKMNALNGIQERVEHRN